MTYIYCRWNVLYVILYSLGNLYNVGCLSWFKITFLFLCHYRGLRALFNSLCVSVRRTSVRWRPTRICDLRRQKKIPRTSRRIDISVLVLGPLPRSHVMLSLWRFPWSNTYVIEQYIFWQYVADKLAALTVADRISFTGSFPMTITKTNLYSLTPLNPTCLQYNWGLQGYALVFLFLFKNIDCAQLAFYVNLHRAVTGPSATLTGRWRPDIDLCRMLTGWVLVRTA